MLDPVSGTLNTMWSVLEDMGIDFRCLDVGMAKERLDGSYVRSTGKKMSGKTVAKSVGMNILVDACGMCRGPDGTLQNTFVDVVPLFAAAAGVN